MVKKILSLLGIIGIMSTMAVNTAFAVPDPALITGLAFVAGKDTATLSGTKMEATFTLSTDADVTGKIMDGTTTVKTLTGADFNCGNSLSCRIGPATATWDGTIDAAAVYNVSGTYSLVISATAPSGDDTETLANVKIALSLISLSTSWDPAKGGSSWDPSKTNATVDYKLTKAADSTVKFMYMDGASEKEELSLRKTDSGKASGSITWPQITDKNSFPLPKTYTVRYSAVDGSKTVNAPDELLVIAYADASAPKLGTITASKTSFSSDTESTVFSFSLTGNAYVLAEIYDTTNLTSPVYTSSDFDGETETQASNSLSLDWNGKNTVCGFVKGGNYLLKLTARNSFGVDSVSSASVTVTSTSTATCLPGSSKITSIVLNPSASSPSSAWDPLEDKLEISWETTVDFDNFTVEARKGNDDPIEIYEEGDIEANNDDAKFEGKDDDDEYIEAGAWKLVFIGENKDGTFYVEKTFHVGYEKPEIDDTFVTKKSIDPDVGEGTYFGFILKTDALVDVEVLKGTVSKVDLLEKEEVKQDVWYAVYWDGKDDDGDDFDYDDTFKIRLTAKSLGDDDVSATATEAIDLDEDDVSSAKSNVTLDGLVPPVVEQGDDVVLTFNVEDDAELRVGIWKGTSTSGSPEAELQAYKSSKAGDYEFSWDTKDEDGKNVKEGFYTYKVFTKKGSTSNVESESGQFVVGDVGDVFGGAEEVSDVDDEPVVEPKTPVTSCGFDDVLAGNKNCAAIKWAKEKGIFEGAFGEFRPYDSINRAEVLAVVMRAFGFAVYGDDGTNLGWKDAVKGSWYMKYLRSGKLYGLLTGYADSTVKPGDSVRRSELLKFVYEAAKKAGVSAVTVCTMNPYADVYADSWYLSYVCQAKTDKLFDVLGDMFLPDEAATRAEVAEALYRLLK